LIFDFFALKFRGFYCFYSAGVWRS